MSLLDQSGVTGGGLDPYNVHALFVNMDNMTPHVIDDTTSYTMLPIKLICLT